MQKKTNSSETVAENNFAEEEVFKSNDDWKRGSVAVGDLLNRIVDPIYARRGFSSSALLSAWAEIVGPTFADCTVPEKISWDRSSGNQTGTLIVRIDGPKSVYLQHERDQILERTNRFLGFQAVHNMKIVQAPINRTPKAAKDTHRKLTSNQEQRLRDHIGEFEDDKLQEAVVSMGREVLKRALSKK